MGGTEEEHDPICILDESFELRWGRIDCSDSIVEIRKHLRYDGRDRSRCICGRQCGDSRCVSKLKRQDLLMT